MRKSAAGPSLLLALTLSLIAGTGFTAQAGNASDRTNDGPSIVLGAPTGPENCGLRDGGCSREYRYGVMVWSPETGSQPVRGAIRTAWAAEGAESGGLGYPVAAQTCTDGNCTQTFERGAITRARTGETTVQRTIDNAADAAVVVNKQRPLNPVTYVPENLVNVEGQQLRSDAASALQQLKDAAAADGVAMRVMSGYRSYEKQAGLYNNYVAQYGQEVADTISARPGHSEHQTGLAVDIASPDGTCSLQACFKDTAAGQWAAANAHRFGFIIRYPEGASETTGYSYEPWHLRYVGTDIAGSIHSQGIATLEEYLGLPPASDY
ncbi:D-alanyl-D-alanine carboxypeptidase family protein [Arthrobacter jiangjiafuii]|uniref:D-alanyl-D-alanine carboxypeptidase family protein n=1 Tax=Arthrobacter jiangjiafuii TaxID=2817475 RepID=UPI001F00AAB9|nr:D-alanyl-D-alanine carboxypeptidase family protein [Arthrobacter jiangjiafuii]